MAHTLGKWWRAAAGALLFAPLLAGATAAQASTTAADQAFTRLADQYFDEF